MRCFAGRSLGFTCSIEGVTTVVVVVVITIWTRWSTNIVIFKLTFSRRIDCGRTGGTRLKAARDFRQYREVGPDAIRLLVTPS